MNETRIRTETGSVYEIDHENKRARRFSASGSGASVRATEEWRAFEHVNEPEIGGQLVIVWTDATPALTPLGGTPATITSPVTEILST